MKEELTLKQKDRVAQTVYKHYRNAQLDLLYLNQHYNYYPQIDVFKIKEPSAKKADAQLINQLEKKQRLENYVKIIDQIHQHLSPASLSFIENEYLNHYDSHWWIYLFSRSTYYRMKHEALDEFIFAITQFWTLKEIKQLF